MSYILHLVPHFGGVNVLDIKLKAEMQSAISAESLQCNQKAYQF